MNASFFRPAVTSALLLASSGLASAATVTGWIQVVPDGGGPALGYIGATTDEQGLFTVTTDLSAALQVTVDDGAENVSVSAPGSDHPAHPFLGAVPGPDSSSAELGSGNANYATLTPSDFSAAFSVPALGGNGFTDATTLPRPLESSIWTLLEGIEFSPLWINPDGSATETFVVEFGGTLALTGDAEAIEAAFGPSQQVELLFVPVPEPSAALLAGAGALIALARRRR